MGYGRYNSGSYSTYGGGGGTYSSSSYGSYSTRSSGIRSSTYLPQSRTLTSHTSENNIGSQTAVNTITSTQQRTGQQITEKAQKVAVSESLEMPKNTQSSSHKSTTQKVSTNAAKKTSKQKDPTQKSRQIEAAKQNKENDASDKKASEQQISSAVVQTAQNVVEEKEQLVVFTEGSFLLEKSVASKNADNSAQKTPDELRLEKEQMRKETKQKDLQDMELQVTKHPKFTALQDKLNARLTSRMESSKKTSKQDKTAESKVKPPAGYVTFGLITIKNTASFLELSLSNEEATLKTLEDIHDLLDKEFLAHNLYKVEAEIGKFLIASKSLDDMINLALKVQITFNEHQWNDMIINLPMFRKLLRPEDLLNDDAVPLFNGPRISIGIHSGEAKPEAESSGIVRYSGDNVIQVKTIGKFAQGGQILVSSSSWSKVNQSKLSKHVINRMGVFKLDNFNSGCSLMEVTPEVLKERAKFYGSVCSHCAKGIQPWENTTQKLDCTWHEDHFKCFNCDESVSEGAYAAYQGLPYCHKCYLASNPQPKCKKCSNNISKDYVNALGAYWHSNCFCCRQCSKRQSSSTPLYEYKGMPYCQPCRKKLGNI